MTPVFTGIIEGLADVVALDAGAESARLSFAHELLHDTALGDSIAVNGVCLTAASVDGPVVVADVMLETLRRSSLGGVRPGDRVNIERAATLGSRLGGHIVQGHVDGVARMASREHGEAWDLVTVELPADLTRYVVDKGSIALDGVSLTVAAVNGCDVSVSLIPETLRRTTWGVRQVGDPVNVEVDIVAKYVERLVAHSVVPSVAGGMETS